MKKSQLLEQRRNKGGGRRSGTSPSLHLNVVLSKAALSCPSVCLRARAPCPLRASCLGADRAESRVLLRSDTLQRIAPSYRLWRSGASPPGSRGRAARAAGLRSGGSLGLDRSIRPVVSLRTDDCCATCAFLCKNRRRHRTCIRYRCDQSVHCYY